MNRLHERSVEGSSPLKILGRGYQPKPISANKELIASLKPIIVGVKFFPHCLLISCYGPPLVPGVFSSYFFLFFKDVSTVWFALRFLCQIYYNCHKLKVPLA